MAVLCGQVRRPSSKALLLEKHSSLSKLNPPNWSFFQRSPTSPLNVPVWFEPQCYLLDPSRHQGCWAGESWQAGSPLPHLAPPQARLGSLFLDPMKPVSFFLIN